VARHLVVRQRIDRGFPFRGVGAPLRGPDGIAERNRARRLSLEDARDDAEGADPNRLPDPRARASLFPKPRMGSPTRKRPLS
jgi:hypothetical protein